MSENILELVQQLKEKANRYDNMRERYEDYGKKINQAIEILNEVLEEVNPFLKEKARRKETAHYTELMEELYKKMQSGEEISNALLSNSYNVQNPSYVLAKMMTMPNVITRKEQGRIILYMQKEI